MFGVIAACFSKEKNLYKAVKNILGFYPGNIFLYRLAFRHKSASRVIGSVKSNNERLEYLGDSVISTAVAHYLFKRYPHQDEGFLTEMRSKMVSRATLNKVAVKMGLHELLNIDSKSGGFKSVDGNALEALMGAVFLDKGYRFTEKIILRRLIAVHIDMDEIEKRDWNYKSKLIDWGQKERCKVHFQVMSTLNQKGKKLYKVAAMVNQTVWGEGMDQSIKAAEQMAAERAYKDKVLPYMEKQSGKGYREPLPDDEKMVTDKADKKPKIPVAVSGSATSVPEKQREPSENAAGMFTITASLGFDRATPEEVVSEPGSALKSGIRPGMEPVADPRLQPGLVPLSSESPREAEKRSVSVMPESALGSEILPQESATLLQDPDEPKPLSMEENALVTGPAEDEAPAGEK